VPNIYKRQMKKIILLCGTLLLINLTVRSQSAEYLTNKAQKIEQGSVFTKIMNREIPATIEYEDEDIIAFVPLRLQAPVHLLIVPKKEIYTINDATEEDTYLLGKLFLVAKKLAAEKGISETGYRLSMNINEPALAVVVEQRQLYLHLHIQS